MQQLVYKVCARSDWATAAQNGSYLGSKDDLRDGFIHLSTARQLPVTLEKFFRGHSDQVLVAIHVAALGTALRWEPSRGGELFPHLYGPLPVAMALSVVALPMNDQGHHTLPEDLT